MEVKILIVALMLIAICEQVNISLTITCEICTISCGFPNCFRL
jgi:hypothetical protein